MLLVVLGHSGLDNDSFLKSWIYGFHMPLFMFVSGYFVQSPRPIKEELKKYFKTIIVPYLFFSLFLIPFYYGINKLSGDVISDDLMSYTSLRLLMDDYYHCGPIWFLGALLIVKIFFNSLFALLRNGGAFLDFLSLISVVLLIIANLFFCIHLLSADTALALMPYYLAGFVCSKLLKNFNRKEILMFVIPGLIVYTLISIYHTGIDYDQMKFGNSIIIMYVEGILGCYAITFLFSLLSGYKNDTLRDIGMNTITILGFHVIFIQVLRFVYKHFVSEIIPLWYLFAISVMSFILCYMMSIIINKYCPVVIGGKKRNR